MKNNFLILMMTLYSQLSVYLDKMYVENGGTVIEQEKKLDEVIEETNKSLKELLDNINKLNSLLDGGRF